MRIKIFVLPDNREYNVPFMTPPQDVSDAVCRIKEEGGAIIPFDDEYVFVPYHAISRILVTK